MSNLHKKIIFDYIPLASSLKGGPAKSCLELDWPRRFKICVGIAKGLYFLHEGSALKIVQLSYAETLNLEVWLCPSSPLLLGHPSSSPAPTLLPAHSTQSQSPTEFRVHFALPPSVLPTPAPRPIKRKLRFTEVFFSILLLNGKRGVV